MTNVYMDKAQSTTQHGKQLHWLSMKFLFREKLIFLHFIGWCDPKSNMGITHMRKWELSHGQYYMFFLSIIIFQDAPEAQKDLFKLINRNNLSKIEKTSAHRAETDVGNVPYL